MLPVLMAQETLAEINAMAAGFGSMDKDQSTQYMFGLRTAASLHRSRDRGAYRPKSPQELASLSAGATNVIIQRSGGGET